MSQDDTPFPSIDTNDEYTIYQRALDSSGDLVWFWDIDSDALLIYGNSLPLLGFKGRKNSSTMQEWTTNLHPDDIQATRLAVIELLKGNSKKIDLTFQHKASDNEWGWLNSKGEVYDRDVNGRAKTVIGHIHFMDEQKKLEAKYENTQLLLQSAFENTYDTLWDWDVPSDSISVSDSWAAALGFPANQNSSLKKDWDPLIHPDDLEDTSAKILSLIKGETKNLSIEYRIKLHDGYYNWTMVRGHVAEKTSDGRTKRIIGILTNIHSLKQQEKATSDRDEQLSLSLYAIGGSLFDYKIKEKIFTQIDYISENNTISHLHRTGDLKESLKTVHPDDRDVNLAFFLGFESSDDSVKEAKWRSCYRLNEYNWHQARGKVVERDEKGVPLRAIGIRQNIDDNYKLELALAQEKEIAQTTLNAINDAVITTDINSKITSLNPTARTLLYTHENEAIGRPLTDICDLFEEDIETPAQDPAALAIHSDLSFNLSTLILKNIHGQQYYIDCSVAPIHNEDSKAIGSVMIIRDVTHARKLSREIEYRAMHDSLTGLYNRQEFESKLYSSTEVEDTEHSLCYLDLDQFKIVNDTCGHIAGDELLRQLSKTLLSSVRKTDILARLGGDEFGILMQNCGLEEATIKAEQILHILSDYTFHWDDNTFKIGASIGIASINSTCSPARSLQNADAACFVAKETGRNRVHVYHIDDDELLSMHGEMGWVPRIQRALEESLFELYVQAIVDLKNNQQRPNHFEILIRLHEDGTCIPPGAFLPAAERYNLSTKIDKWVIEKAFSTINSYADQIEVNDVFNINLSAPSLIEKGFVTFIKEQFKQYNINPSNICFEITETSAIANLSSAQGFIKTLHNMGCEFALDDFGSGLSSFGYLKNLPVDYLKIDGLFIKDILDDPIDAAMVRSINEIGQIMGKKTVAEWVENEAIADILKKIGVDYAQGYHYSKPQPFTKTLSELSVAQKELKIAK